MTDQIIVEFETVGDLTRIQAVTNWTAYNLTRDFFKMADGFTLVCEDDRSAQLSADLQVGQRLKFLINNCCVLIGYIDEFDLSYMRGGKGKSLTIHGRDICGILGDAHLYPNLGHSATTQTITSITPINAIQQLLGHYDGNSGQSTTNQNITNNGAPTAFLHFNGETGEVSEQTTANGTQTTTTVNVINYQFDKNTTLKQALLAILVNGLTPITNIIIDDSIGNITLQTAVGLKIGGKSKAKTGRGLTKRFSSALARLCKPEKSESYLHYAARLVKHAGCFIKCMPGTDNTLLVSPPTYDRIGTVPPFYLNHSYVNPSNNNCHEGKMRVSYKDQPSVIIGECTSGDATLRKQTFKIVCINELTGYIPGSTSLNVNTALPTISQAIGLLTTGVPGTGKATIKTIPFISQETIGENGNPYQGTFSNNNGATDFAKATGQGAQLVNNSEGSTIINIIPPTGYYLLPPNTDLYNALNRTVIGVQTNFSRPLYYQDYNAQTNEELMFAVAEMMADFQDKFFSLDYRVDQHTNNKAIWNTNLMVTVTDDAFAPNNQSVANQYWIQKVNFIKSRSGGTETLLQLNLPYTHMTNFTE